ncbi:MAG: hypothetical protein JOZ47_21280 [Kutzneria sp.]|nr:hypothetical protein [Kutzneria sp.]MBV9847580.1 hypothetical protein [Kutzneria sp.]
MVGYVLLVLIVGYTLVILMSYCPPIRRATTWIRLGGRTFRLRVPHWGFFAQRSGIFDLEIWWRAQVRGGWTDWVKLLRADRTWYSFIWRPERRSDQTSQVLTRNVLAQGGMVGEQRAFDSLDYQRVLERVRAEVSAVSPRADQVDSVQFRIEASRGFWTQEKPKTLFVSREEAARGETLEPDGPVEEQP